MCSRIMRDPLARQSAAEYLGDFIADETDGGFTRGTQWLVWKFESDSTLQIASSVSPGFAFFAKVDEITLCECDNELSIAGIFICCSVSIHADSIIQS